MKFTKKQQHLALKKQNSTFPSFEDPSPGFYTHRQFSEWCIADVFAKNFFLKL